MNMALLKAQVSCQGVVAIVAAVSYNGSRGLAMPKPVPSIQLSSNSPGQLSVHCKLVEQASVPPAFQQKLFFVSLKARALRFRV